jgi:PAS domain S-box-containing protein
MPDDQRMDGTDDVAHRLAAIVDSLDDAIVGTTLDGIITSWNRGAERLFGYTAAEAIGQSILLIIPKEREPEEADVLRRMRAGERVDHFETERRHRNGALVEVSVSVSPIRDTAGRIIGASKVARDIGERRRSEELRARLAAIVDSSDDAIVSKTLDGIVTSWNQGAERLFGYAAAEVIGQSILLIIPPERHGEEVEVLRRIRSGARVDHFETVRRRKDGTLVDISLSVSPIRSASGHIIGASKVARDIRDRKRAEALRAKVHADLEQTNRAKDEFLAMLGHELRNPLGVMSTAVALLSNAADDADTAFAREVFVRQIDHLSRIVDDLLDVSRVMTGKIRLDRVPIDVREVARRYVATAADTLARHVVTVTGDSVWVSGDAVRIEQILTNLVGNAVKYTPPACAVTIRVGRNATDALLQVEDDGPGIPEHLRDRIFELFVQGERSLDRAQGGLGIGLALVRRLTELHGGTVHVDAGPQGRGACFTVRLPAIPAPQATDREADGSGTPSGVRRRVLVVEDNDLARELTCRLLRRAGHEVHEAADGLAGLDLAIQLQPDVALIDLGLPKLNGYEVARRIRLQLAGHPIRLVALTGYGLAEDRELAAHAGFDVHLVKPVDPRRLASAIVELATS